MNKNNILQNKFNNKLPNTFAHRVFLFLYVMHWLFIIMLHGEFRPHLLCIPLSVIMNQR